MASWIVHLRIAENLLGIHPSLNPELFSIGNIAPDSGIPDANWENFTPPPAVTHFENPNSQAFHSGDLVFYRQHLHNGVTLSGDPDRFSVLFGYFAHLVTDNLWSIRIGRPTRKRYLSQFEADPKFIWEVKKDWYGLDFIYIRDHPDCLFWRIFTRCQYNRNDLDFIPLEAIQQRIAYIQEYYQSSGPEVQAAYRRPYIYLSKEGMDAFVSEASDLIEAIYHHLWVSMLPFESQASTMELVGFTEDN